MKFSIGSIKVYDSVNLMTGRGEEWLCDQNNEIRAIFIDGMFKCSIIPLFEGNEDVTLKGIAKC